MRHTLLVALAAALLAPAFAMSAAPAAPDFAAVKVDPYDPPKPAPAFSLPDLDGKTRSLGDYRGKVLMLVFWATW